MPLDGKFNKGKIQHIHLWGSPEHFGDKELIRLLLKELVAAIGMTPHGEVSIHEYPTKELGFTATACVAVQHLHESYVVYDNSIEYSPAYANIVVNSCKPFDIAPALNVVNRILRPTSIRVSGADYYSPGTYFGGDEIGTSSSS